jgi:hypothetical protein
MVGETGLKFLMSFKERSLGAGDGSDLNLY